MPVRIAVASGLTALLVLLALLRPVNHDESQYVAAAVLVAQGLLPYRDFAYLQTPLQSLLFAPVVAIAGEWAWPALRVAGALLGAAAVVAVHAAARAGGAGARASLLTAGLFAVSDTFLFGVGVVRNDALPVALFAAALIPIMRAERGDATRTTALLAGLLLAAAAAAKVSYAVPAAAYGLYTLVRPSHRPGFVLLGAAAATGLTAWTWWLSPEGFAFGVLDYPNRGPAEYYADRPWKMSYAAKAIDTAKFLALGATLPLAAWVAIHGKGRRPGALKLLVVAGVATALLPFPTWRQYLVPILPPLFVLAAVCLTGRRPARGWRAAIAVFATAGVAYSVGTLFVGMPFPEAMRQSAALGRALDAARVIGRVATLAPQFLPAAGAAIHPAYAAGPFYFRSATLLDDAAERRLTLVSHARPRLDGVGAVVVGAEARVVSGNDAVDAALAEVARDAGWREAAVPGSRFRLFTPSITLPPGALPISAARNRP
jgi:hypothetical protein